MFQILFSSICQVPSAAQESPDKGKLATLLALTPAVKLSQEAAMLGQVHGL